MSAFEETIWHSKGMNAPGPPDAFSYDNA
jgi:hypothetical protein